MKPIVELSNVQVRYRLEQSAGRSFKTSLLKSSLNSNNSRIVLDNLSLKASSGDVVGVLGRNGSGKSTLIKTIAGMAFPTQGFVKTYGLLTAIIELGAGLNLEFSCKENIKLHAAIYGVPKENLDQMVQEVCYWAGLQEYIESPLRTLSSGMIARFSFSLVTHVKPDILLLDEVLSVGDEEFQQKSLERTLQLMSGGTITFIVSHNLDTIRKFATRAIWLEKGKVRDAGDANLLCDRYQESF